MERFYGSPAVVQALRQMTAEARIPQTMLFSGPQGVGKATLARRFGADLLSRAGGGVSRIEQDDLSLPTNLELIAEREKWPAEKRNEEPLVFASHPDFMTFAPDGPLQQISIQQMRLLREYAQYKPSAGDRRVFLIDQIDRANEQAANSLLKILEEPPDHLVIIMTAQNPYDLLPTIRSRAVMFGLAPLSEEQMQNFVKQRGLDHPQRRIALAQGSPGLAASLDLETYDRRRAAMLTLLKAAAGAAPFSSWLKPSETVSNSKSERLDAYLRVLYILLEDLLLIQNGSAALRNPDVAAELSSLAAQVHFRWIRKAVQRLDELREMVRRNIQKTIALDAFILEMREEHPSRASSQSG
jgi:DNA polymerase III subunit delta'